MTTGGDFQNYGPVLFYYDLYPERIESYGKVKKVITKRGTFALKEAAMEDGEREWFTHVIQRLSEIGFHQVVPLYPTKYGDYTVKQGSKVYYLMPWFPSSERAAPFQDEVLIDYLAKIHSLTVKEQDFLTEVADQSFQYLMGRWESRQFEMERFTELAEQRTYMAPFELTYLSHFHQTMRMAEDAKRSLNSWHEGCKREKRYRSVLCHGKVSRSHLLYSQSGEGHLFNFEKAVLDTPVRDLAMYFRKAAHKSSWKMDDGFALLKRYEKQFPLLYEERELLISYLSFPEPIFNAVDAYQSNSKLSQIEVVHVLESRLSAMKRIRDFCEHLSRFPLAGEQQPGDSAPPHNEGHI
ncbi:spore coat protein YsxE [Fictibacillus iocasae]|uniref:Spore coat protein YsxE n=1 Tax=Fictibacillus iocasae TaxID=2715437 RepID=A0ABW2NKQ7_9BACL